MTSTVNLIFRGLFISCIGDGRDFAEIGMIRGAKDHQLDVTINVNGSEFTPQDLDTTSDFFLEALETSESGIRVFTEDGFDRAKDEGNPKDFRWFVDIESQEFFDRRLGVIPDQVGPIIRVNNGEFFTSSRTPIKAVKKIGDQTFPLGKIGLEIGATIKLEKPGSTAILRNESHEILRMTSSANAQYQIVFDSDCKGRSTSSDFKLIYKAIGAGLQENQKIDIAPDPGENVQRDDSGLTLIPIFTPMLRCTGGNLSVTTSLSGH